MDDFINTVRMKKVRKLLGQTVYYKLKFS